MTLTFAKPLPDITSDEARWAAVVARDASFAGQFYLAVKTTGVYCRPGCPARLPSRANVRFFDTSEEAEGAGFRACKRCRPDQASLEELHAEKVAESLPADRDGGRSAGPRSACRCGGAKPLSFPSHLQGNARRDAEGLCDGEAQRRVRERLGKERER